ncbi:MAG: tRNA pseudouridine(13) synthase TruD [Desulfurococcales archaeon]|nr:tRNA pseudouridine(13) synthase TruD [Desulfurococcales archaeon]
MDYLPENLPRAWIPRPHGFLVVERPPIPVRGDRALYLVRKTGLTSVQAGSLLMKALGASLFELQGLKDRHAVAYQYVTLRNPSRTPPHLTIGERLEAWLIRRNVQPLKPGLHGLNFFKIKLEFAPPRPNPPQIEPRPFLNYIGPQRFGVCKPDSHLQGLALTQLSLEELAILETSGCTIPPSKQYSPGNRARRTPWAPGRNRSRLLAEALQAYLFNRALAEAAEQGGGDPGWAAERLVRLPCPSGVTVKVPAGRLPGPWADRGDTGWARLVAGIATREGIPLQALPGGERPPLRAFQALPCRLWYRDSEDAMVLGFTLPRGVYATVYLRHIVRLDWERECEFLAAGKL